MVCTSPKSCTSGIDTVGSRAGRSTRRNQTVKARRRLACAGSCNQATKATTTRCTPMLPTNPMPHGSVNVICVEA